MFEINPLQWELRGQILPQVRNPFSALPVYLYLSRPSDGEVAVLAQDTTFPLSTKTSPPTPAPGPNWFGFRNKSDSWFAFEWGPGARIYIIGLDYVGSDINRGSQRCQGDQGYFVLTDFLLLQFVHCLKWTWQIWKQGHPRDTDVAPSLQCRPSYVSCVSCVSCFQLHHSLLATLKSDSYDNGCTDTLEASQNDSYGIGMSKI